MFTFVSAHLQVGEERYISSPFDGAEQQPSGQFADVLDAHQVPGRRRRQHRRLRRTGRVGHRAVAAGRRRVPSDGWRVRLGPQQHRDETRQVRRRAAVHAVMVVMMVRRHGRGGVYGGRVDAGRRPGPGQRVAVAGVRHQLTGGGEGGGVMLEAGRYSASLDGCRTNAHTHTTNTRTSEGGLKLRNLNSL